MFLCSRLFPARSNEFSVRSSLGYPGQSGAIPTSLFTRISGLSKNNGGIRIQVSKVPQAWVGLVTAPATCRDHPRRLRRDVCDAYGNAAVCFGEMRRQPSCPSATEGWWGRPPLASRVQNDQASNLGSTPNPFRATGEKLSRPPGSALGPSRKIKVLA
ncbi:hypothetical protein NDU88_003708 [Pleurodeles waltl]|uniref:Uncharacterized protein n=1 Tax=Pleurodeles waltl TaxID=8319 RepID=A0AAV7W700_PLEWA|nr:hypothetical protein NDU88_003708 [Pleurodeles waltl]